MKKLSITLLGIFFLACEKPDEIFQFSEPPISSIEISTPPVSSKTKSLFNQPVYIPFDYGISSIDGGCTVRWVSPTGTGLWNNVYGPNPVTRNDGYVVRGFGTPQHSPDYGSLVMVAKNNQRSIPNRRGDGYHIVSDPRGTALSIEYAFEANVTYEIQIKCRFVDNNVLWHGFASQALPIVHVGLRDSAEIPSQFDPCSDKGIDAIPRIRNIYQKKVQLDVYNQQYRTFTYNFSPLETKNALVVSLHPDQGDDRGPSIPISTFTMVLPQITIIKKVFDPIHNEMPSTRG